MKFWKLHGAGNDFVMTSDPERRWDRSAEGLKRLCDRRRGIGADGVIFLDPSPGDASHHAVMEFYNNDGSRAEMCGNGLRCAALFAYTHLGLPRRLKVKTDAGILGAEIAEPGRVTIEIPVNKAFENIEVDGRPMCFGVTGVPHCVVFAADVAAIDVQREGAALRWHGRFAPKGTNVDFVSPATVDGAHNIRTYERGVEAETLACGTGITAAALCLHAIHKIAPPVRIRTVGGDYLEVDFPVSDNIVTCARLTGPAVEVFEGNLK